uniref:Neuronal acetylcholine receptor subunit beta-3-like n=1 Tax=Phallusia mammillata TaxID=59560 RepID=A0A6F9D9X2_9ASCI|nr:neuronal acetylcholine receptor subunit beta-3-like [Phallusia mammillata]
MYLKLHLIAGIVTWFCVDLSKSGKGGGKTASKVGLAAISQAGSLPAAADGSHALEGDIHLDGVNGTLMQNNMMAKLNEKDQILKSLLRSRLSWIDQYLTWEPDQYDGITSIRLPSSMVWMPDIVCYEEIGTKDYSPRVPYVEISSDGTVRYFEPTAFETTCSVNIAYFPFDHQVCLMTFTSWSFPTSKLDVQSFRTSPEYMTDISVYFVKTGEWILDEIVVKKISQSYASILAEHEGEDEDEHEEHEDVDRIIEQQYFYMDPKKTVKEVAESRHSDLHWSEIQFQYKLRRNSSLYMQSMLFPALLLTTISLLGFYLPPDSGERIGLQITIMLTFMVFLLTVGDMFPASTGPYLGLYFVLCMAMLGLNMVMTVLILNLHHMPYAAVMRGPNDKGEYTVAMKAVPIWIRMCLFLSGLYSELTDFKLTEEDIRGKKNKPRKPTAITEKVKPMLKKYKSFVRSKTMGTIKVEDIDHEGGCDNGSFSTSKSEQDATNRYDKKSSRIRFRKTSSVDLEEQLIKKKKKFWDSSKLQTLCDTLASGSDSCREFLSARRDLAFATDYLRCQYDELKDDKRAEAIAEKWKDVARKLDAVCLRVYIFVLVVLHLCLLVAILVEF